MRESRASPSLETLKSTCATRAAAGARQLRAGARRGARAGRAARRRAATAAARHQPGAAAAARRAGVRVPPLALPDLRDRPRPRELAGLRGGEAVRRAGAGRGRRLRAHRRRTPRPWRRSASGSTACRWRSSWRPLACGCSRPRRCCAASTSACTLLTGGARDLPSASGRSAARSTGATTSCSRGADAVRAAGVFVGGCRLEAAEAVGDPGGVPGATCSTACVAGREEPAQPGAGRDGEPRFGMLETIREFAARAARRRGAEMRCAAPRSLTSAPSTGSSWNRARAITPTFPRGSTPSTRTYGRQSPGLARRATASCSSSGDRALGLLGVARLRAEGRHALEDALELSAGDRRGRCSGSARSTAGGAARTFARPRTKRWPPAKSSATTTALRRHGTCSDVWREPSWARWPRGGRVEERAVIRGAQQFRGRESRERRLADDQRDLRPAPGGRRHRSRRGGPRDRKRIDDPGNVRVERAVLEAMSGTQRSPRELLAKAAAPSRSSGSPSGRRTTPRTFLVESLAGTPGAASTRSAKLRDARRGASAAPLHRSRAFSPTPSRRGGPVEEAARFSRESRKPSRPTTCSRRRSGGPRARRSGRGGENPTSRRSRGRRLSSASRPNSLTPTRTHSPTWERSSPSPAAQRTHGPLSTDAAQLYERKGNVTAPRAGSVGRARPGAVPSGLTVGRPKRGYSARLRRHERGTSDG